MKMGSFIQASVVSDRSGAVPKTVVKMSRRAFWRSSRSISSIWSRRGRASATWKGHLSVPQ